jgi:hypothetical protein
MADWLVLTEAGASLPVLTRYVGGFNRTVLSAPFSALKGEPNTDQSLFNAAMQIDDSTIYAVTNLGLWVSTDGGATLGASPVNAFTNPNVTAPDYFMHGGIHYVYDQGNKETYIAGWFKDSSDFVIGWRKKLSDGTYNETTSGVNIGNTSEVFGGEILYGPQIHFFYGAGTSQFPASWDPISQSWAFYAPPFGTVAADSCFAVAPDGLLYLVAVSGVSWKLARFTGSWSDAGILNGLSAVGNRSQAKGTGRSALFSDGTNLHAVLGVAGAGGQPMGWRHMKITAASGFDPTVAVEITNTGPDGPQVPADLRSALDGQGAPVGTANANLDKRCIVVQDTETTPGTLRTFLCFSDDAQPGTPWSVREFLGDGGGTYDPVGAGGAVRDALPNASRGGGGYFFTPAQDGVRILQVDAATGAETISFVASGGGTVTVRFRRGAKGQPPTAIATLIGPVTGSGGALGADVVTGVLADGSTVYTVGWDFFTDSLGNAEALAVLVPETL